MKVLCLLAITWLILLAMLIIVYVRWRHGDDQDDED